MLDVTREKHARHSATADFALDLISLAQCSSEGSVAVVGKKLSEAFGGRAIQEWKLALAFPD